MSIILNILMWYGIITVASIVGFIGIVIYDRIKYGKIPVCEDEDC